MKINPNKLISKIAADKESKKMGKIIRIERLPGKTIKKLKPYAMIFVTKRFKKKLVFPLELDRITKIEGTYVWFDISTENFEKEVKRLREIQTEQDIYPEDTGMFQIEGTKKGAMDFFNLGHRRKERKR